MITKKGGVEQNISMTCADIVLTPICRSTSTLQRPPPAPPVLGRTIKGRRDLLNVTVITAPGLLETQNLGPFPHFSALQVYDIGIIPTLKSRNTMTAF